MKRNFTNEQIVYTLRQAEGGTSVAEVCRKTGITEQTYYRWKKKFAGMGVAELARLRQLEDENSKPEVAGRRSHLRQAYAARGAQKKVLKRERRMELVTFLCVGFRIPQRRACRLVDMQRSSYYYRSRSDPQTELRVRLKDMAGARVRYGYRRLHILLQREGWQINHKRVYRLYKLEGLSLRLKTKKKRVSAPRVPLPAATSPNGCWSMDFVMDRLSDGRSFRMLTLVDNFSRVSPSIEIDFSLTGKRVVDVLERLKLNYGLPKTIKVDNGSEFISKAMDEWAHRNNVKLDFSRPGKPTDNAFIESFNGRLRQECLNQNWFTSLADAKQIIEAWREDYNEIRPHSSLDHRTPSEFVVRWQQIRTAQKAEILTLETVQ